MPTLENSRQDFLSEVSSYVHSDEHARFARALDDFIAWSETRPEAVAFADHEYDQNVVSFRETANNYVLWSAYPKIDGGAKFEILPGAADALDPTVRENALSILRSLTREPLSDATTLRLPFAALKKQRSRDRVKELLVHLIADLKGGPSVNSPLAG
jgi:hypothetical protein